MLGWFGWFGLVGVGVGLFFVGLSLMLVGLGVFGFGGLFAVYCCFSCFFFSLYICVAGIGPYKWLCHSSEICVLVWEAVLCSCSSLESPLF